MSKKCFLVVAVILALVVGLTGPVAAAGTPEMVKVLIGFDRQPGPDEEAVVRGAGGNIKYTYHLVPAIAASVPRAAIDGLMKNPRVTRVEPDITVYAIDSELDNSWGVERIGAGIVHDGGNRGTGVKVAIIDSGVDYTHPDLDDNYAGGYDFVNGDPDARDDDGYVTHVAGSIAAEDNDVGVVGVAPEARIYALKVLEGGTGSYSDVIAALQWAVDNGIQVTNNSYGSSGDPGETVKAAFDNAYAAGVLHIAAAGNGGNPPGKGDNVIYPARWDSVIAVAATDQTDSRARWSSTGPDVELAAPGVAINSTLLGGGYGEMSGTSMASPHVAGTGALVIAAGITDANGNGRINDEVRQKLADTADDLGDPGRDTKYDYGLVDADEAAVSGNPPTVSWANPKDGDTVSGVVTVQISASDTENAEGNLTVEWQVDGSGWKAASYNPDTGYYEASWDTSAEAEGDHSLEARATDSDNNSTTASIAVTVDNVNDSPVASFTYTSSGLTVDFDASDSYDPDGTITSYDWDFGDGNAGSGVTVSHTYASAGTYTVTLTVTDDDGATDSNSQSATVSEAANTMHVGDLDGSKNLKGKSGRWEVLVTVTIHDENHNPLANATVTGKWSGAISGTIAGTTGSDGTVTLGTGNMAGGSSVTFTVTNVTHDTLTYDATANHDPDGDSDGTSITVTK